MFYILPKSENNMSEKYKDVINSEDIFSDMLNAVEKYKVYKGPCLFVTKHSIDSLSSSQISLQNKVVILLLKMNLYYL